MTSTRLITIGRRGSQYLAVTTFAIGLAVGSAAVASAEWDIEAYDDCLEMLQSPVILGPDTPAECCIASGGDLNSLSGKCQSPPVNDPMTGQPAPPRSPEDIVTGPTRQFNVPDASVPGDPIVVLPTP